MEPVPWRRGDGQAHAPGRRDSRRRQQGDGVARPQRQRAGRPRDAPAACSPRWPSSTTRRAASARRLSFGRTLTISVVTSFLTRPQAAERLRGVDAVLSDSEFDLVIYNVETVEKRDQYLRGLALAQRTDGLLVISLPPRDEDVRRLSSAAIPVVVVDAHAPVVEGLPHVVGDDIAGGEAATRHLLELGHRRIAFLGDEFDNPFGFTSSRHRFIGYERALATAGLRSEPDLVALGRAQPLRGARAGRASSWPPTTARPPSSPPATRRPWASSAPRTRRAARPRRPVGRRLRRHRDRRLPRSSRPSASSCSSRVASAPSCSSPRSAPVQTTPPSIVLSPEVVVRGTTAPPKEGEALP